MPSVNKFLSYSPATDEQAAEYGEGEGGGPLCFQLYFGDGWRSSRWNRKVVKDMTASVLLQVVTAKLDVEPSRDLVEACLWGFIEQAQVSWRSDKPRVTEDGNRVETAEEAHSRAQEYAKRHAKDVRLTTHKTNVSLDLFV